MRLCLGKRLGAKRLELTMMVQTAGTHRRIGMIAVVLLGLSLVLTPRSAEARDFDKDTRAYRRDLGAASPALDIYAPKDARNAPVLIYVHGGAWVAGQKSAVNAKPEFFTSLGYIFVSVEYRLVPKVDVTKQLDDISAALSWVAANISAYGGDASNLNLMGHSAGAHLVTMTAVAPSQTTAALIDSGALRSVISNDTRSYDIAAIARGARGGKMPLLYVRAFGEEPDFWRAMSPIHQLRGGRIYPAFLVLYSGQGDDVVRARFATDFAGALSDAGAQVSLFDGASFSHREINVGVGKDARLSGAIADFLAAGAF